MAAESIAGKREAGTFGPAGRTMTMEQAKEAGEKLDNSRKTAKGNVADKQTPPYPAPESPPPRCAQDDDSDDPLSYLRKRVSGKPKSKSVAKKRPQTQSDMGSPLKKARTGAVQKSIRAGGGSAPAGALTPKQQEITQRHQDTFTDLTSQYPTIKEKFKQGTLDKAFVTNLKDAAEKAITYYADPKKGWDLKKVEQLSPIKDGLVAQVIFLSSTAKKTSKAADLEKAMAACSAAGVEVPLSFGIQYSRTVWSTHMDSKDYNAALESLFLREVLTVEGYAWIQASVLGFLSPCKPARDPRGRPMVLLAAFIDAFSQALGAVKAEYDGVTNSVANCLMITQVLNQVETAKPTLLQTLQDKPGVRALEDSIDKLIAAKSSLSDDRALLRAIALLPVGKAFIQCAQEILHEAGWANSICVKLRSILSKLQEKEVVEDLTKCDSACVELRAHAMDAQVQQVLLGQKADDGNLYATTSQCLLLPCVHCL